VCERQSSTDKLEVMTVGAGGVRFFGGNGKDGL
jgi:hypothetical protein